MFFSASPDISGLDWCWCCCRGKKTPESQKLPQIGATEAVQAAKRLAVSDMGPVLQNAQPAACEVGPARAANRDRPPRAQEGAAAKLYQIITEKRAPDHTGSIDGIDEADPEALPGWRRTTRLIQDDLAVEWRGVP